MMQVTLSDPIIEVTGWTPDLDKLGAYIYKRRKTPEEIREEKIERRNRFGEDAWKVSQIESIPMTCLSKDETKPGVCYFLPGLWPRVREYFDTHGLQYTVVDKRNPDIRPPLDMRAFDGVDFRETQDVAVALISSLDCGVIETTTGYGKSLLISLLCKAYPTLNIVVTTSSTSVVNTLYEYLSNTIPGQVGVLHATKDTTAGKRVVCTTLKSLPNISPDNVQLVFVDECHAIGNNDAGRALMKFCWARRFGFSASPVRNDGTGKVMESLLGPTILKMTYQEATDAGMVTPMKYLMLPCSGCPPAAKNLNLPDVALKRVSYWQNNARNGAIRRFVYDLKSKFDGQIMIMVSTLVHAIELHKMLPWFKVAYYGRNDTKALTGKLKNVDLSQYKMNAKQLDIMRKAFAKGTLKYLICTKVMKQGVNFPHLQVLIRADGDVSAVEGIQIPGRLSRLDEDKKYAYLIDVADTFSPWAHGRAQARQKLYQEQQWQQISYQSLIDELGSTKGNSEETDGTVHQ